MARDVTIMGAGIFGLSVAWACLRRGARVRVIDPGGPGAGSSGGIVGALAPHVPENWNAKKAFQLDSLLMAEAWWAEVEGAGGTSPGYARAGRLQPVADDAGLELARRRAETARDLWQGCAEWRVVAADAADPFQPHSPSGFLIHDTLTARLHPGQACAALAAAITAKGGTVARDGAPEGQVVWATGWQGLEALSETFGKRVGTGIKGQAVLLDYDARNAAQLFVDGLHIVPHGDGTTAIGSTTEREFGDPAATDGQTEDLLARARAAVPDLSEASVLNTWAGVRPRAKTRAPMLGAWPERAGHFIANGGFKIGFGMAPKAGEIMADLVLEGRDEIPDGFRVTDNL
ncbi:Glycine oxidase [Roseivivax sp. THAF40]|uniref:NAD(P)/FAD-dependent oxidoreductase n=1 Tax=unclassified Roseivivax TaxID=2639302 RepID=UPI001268EEFD|nr:MULTISPECIES: FAD-dependent oxidoreductase [unclassified Roseivivax]QFS84506.1 Glycine oxidase [Roseivivax sp. THAF197b]QFT48334.1 Glycine oxidase [Roseivivax sp. THAF40]